MSPRREILFLLGPTSPLWRELAQGFEDAGHGTHKIVFAAGDALWWRRPGAKGFRAPFSRWEGFLSEFVRRKGITDILYYGDRHPYHVVAQKVARRLELIAVAIENGYLRPDWLTVELGGMGVYSQFPEDPAEIRRLAKGLPSPDLKVRHPHGYWEEIISEISYHTISEFARIAYPFYRHGHYYYPCFEYLVGIPHVLGARRRMVAANGTIAELEATQRPFHLVALQLQGDQQIHWNSPFRHIGDMIEMVIASHATHAGAEALLVFKQHPHDNGWENWPRRVAAAARRYGVSDRVRFLDGGDLGRLLAAARGCVVINSTVGLHAIRSGCPTKTLGVAIYDVPGLTHQGHLDTFWTAPESIDDELLDCFLRLLADRIQVKGSFYAPEGRRAAVTEIVRRVVSGIVNGGKVETVPPRLEAAQRRGVPIDHSISASTEPTRAM